MKPEVSKDCDLMPERIDDGGVSSLKNLSGIKPPSQNEKSPEDCVEAKGKKKDEE